MSIDVEPAVRDALAAGRAVVALESTLLCHGVPRPRNRRLADEIAALETRVAERQTIVRAVAALSAQGVDDSRAYAQLRSLAMSWQVSVEQAARRIVAMTGEGDEHSNRA